MLRVACLGLVALACGLGAAPAAAAAGPATVVLYDELIEQGQATADVYVSDRDPIRVRASPLEVEVEIARDPPNMHHLEFAAPHHDRLVRGVYAFGQRAAFREGGFPGLDIGSNHQGCNVVSGNFEVRDIRYDARGRIARLWLLFEHHCEHSTLAEFGEIRIGMPAPSRRPLLLASHVRWPDGDVGRPGAAVPVTLLAQRQAVTIDRAAVEGDREFEVTADECSGRVVPAGGRCAVWLRPLAASAGTHRARLVLRERGGRAHRVPLEAHAWGGRTRFVAESEPGDYIGQGRPWSFTPANARLSQGRSLGLVTFGVSGDDGMTFDGAFAATPGATLVPGHYPGATRYPFNETNPGIDVNADHRGCNESRGEFTITELGLNPDGTARSVGATFTHHCDSGAALRGVFEWRAGDPTRPARWLRQGSGACGAARFAGPRRRSGTRRSDRMSGSARPDRLEGRGGRDVVAVLGGDDCAYGGHGRDRLSGGPGADVLDGGPGPDVLSGGPGHDVLVGGTGRDVLRCGPGSDAVYATDDDEYRGCEHVFRYL